MAISLPDARLLSDDILQALRLRALRGCELGFSETDVANLLGVSRETVSRWWSAYSSQGLDALPQERTGRPRAPDASCPTHKPAASRGSSTTTVPRIWASLLPCGTVAPC